MHSTNSNPSYSILTATIKLLEKIQEHEEVICKIFQALVRINENFEKLKSNKAPTSSTSNFKHPYEALEYQLDQ